MATFSDAFSARTTHFLELVMVENSTNSAANTSSVTGVLQINPPSDSGSWNGYSDQNSYSFTFNGTTYTGNYTFDFRTNRSTQVLKSVTATITHNADGTKTVTGSGSSTSGTLGSASIGTSSFTLTDFVRLPSAPASPTLTRNSAGTSITVVSAVASSPVTPSNYDLRWSYDGSTWTTVTGIGTDRTHVITVDATSTVYVQTRAISSEGTGPWSSSATVVGIPTAPTSINAVRTSRNVTVTAGSATGTGITGYSVQYSTDAGSTWSTAQAMTSQSYTYTNLTPALTYLFRVYATNSIGNSAFTTTATGVFVPAGGKRYDGATFTPTTVARRWDGSAWTDITIARRWNGSSWVDLS
jgi:hypothetical protein